MSYTEQARSFVNRARNQDRARTLAANVASTETQIERKLEALDSVPAYRRDCIVKRIERSEAHLEELKTSLAFHRSRLC